jgi:PadR family transcriptional regulator PadR
VSERNQRAKFYQLTPAGKRQLSTQRSRWKQMIDAIGGLMGAVEREGLS